MKKKTLMGKLLCLLVCTVLSAAALASFAGCGGEPAKEKTLTKIEVYQQPLKTQYYIGESFDKSGMRILAYYANGEAEIVTDWTYSPTEPLTAENDAVTVTYTEGEITKTCTQEISVVPEPAKPTGIAIVTAPTKTEYTEGEKFDPAGMSVKLVLSDESEGRDVTADVVYAPSRALTVDDTEITLSYKHGDDTFTAKQPVTVKEGVATITFGGGSYQKAHDIVIDEDVTLYELSEGFRLEKWTYNGVYQDSPFGRAKAMNANQHITFTLDFSAVEDKSEIGFSANLIKVRARPLIEVSTDKQIWEHIGFQSGMPEHIYNSDYAETVTSLRGRAVGDPNLTRMYWSLSDYADVMGEDGLLYVRFGYTSEYENTLSDNVGADVIDGVCYYEKITFTELDNRFTLTLGDGVKFKDGSKTAVLRPGKFLPEVVFDDTEIESELVSWRTDDGTLFKPGMFKMPAADTTLNMVYSNDKYTLTLEGDVEFEGGGKTVELHLDEKMPAVTFSDSGIKTENVYWLDSKGHAWKNGEFTMPAESVTLKFVSVVNPYNGANITGAATQEGQYLIGDGGYGQQTPGVTVPNNGRGELISTEDGKLAQLYNLSNMKDGYAFRLQTGPKRQSNTDYTYDIEYTLYNMSEHEVTITVYQINSGKDTTGCKNGSVTLQPGESKTVSLAEVGFAGDNNFLTYFVFNGATADVLPIAVHTYITPVPVASHS